MTTKKKHYTGVILAGGEGSRLGYRAKGLISIKGKPIIEHLIDRLTPLTDDILISANSAHYDYLNLPIVRDEFQQKGPLSGLYSTIKASTTSYTLVVACDMPKVSTSFLTNLRDHSYTNTSQAVIPQHSNQLQPLCAVYRKSCYPIFEKALVYNLLSLHRVCNLLDYHPYKVSPHTYSETLMNINTFKDYQHIKQSDHEYN